MSDLFFYGTLRYVPLLERVLGRPSSALSTATATLPDHAVFSVRGQDFPVIKPQTGAQASGLLVRDLSEQDLARLAYYEGGFDYGLQPLTIRLEDGAEAAAQIFFSDSEAWVPDGLWSLEEWSAKLGEVTALAAEEELAYFGRVPAKDMARSMPAMQTRAWSKLFARQRRTGDTRDVSKDVIVHRHHRAYVDYFGMEEIDLQHRQHDGTMGPVLKRASLMQGSAVAVLPYDPVRDTVLLVEQFRPPVFLLEDPEPWLWEAVAGMIDPGETPEQAAHREGKEEAGINFDALHSAGEAYSSSGSSTGYVYFYVGLASLTSTVTAGGLDTEGEDIRSEILPFETFIDRVDRGEFKDLQLLNLAHWLARHRERLRG